MDTMTFLIRNQIYFLLLIFSVGYSQKRYNASLDRLFANNPLVVQKESYRQKKWVDSVYQQMSLEQKIGQLFMVAVFSSASTKNTNRIHKLIEQHHIGGIIFSKGGPYRQIKLHNAFQKKSKIPLLIGMDAEWGLSMRLDSTYTFPWNMTLGAIQNNQLIENTGKQIARHCKRLGVHINFAPVVDINTNPKNPIIGNRSFGEDKDNVTEKAFRFMKGMQQEGVLANAKHFPGHGDTDRDSHKTLPTIRFDAKRIDSIELYPYRKLFKQGLSSVMVAHLNIPSLESRREFPSSISKNVVTHWLQDSLRFRGLIFTDALNMKGASNFKKSGEIDLAAFKAGNDVLLISENVPLAAQKIKKAYEDGEISEDRLALSVQKILMAKYKVGLQHYRPISKAFLSKDLHSPANTLLHHQLVENALTVIKNHEKTLPIEDLELHKIAYVPLGDAPGQTFFEALNLYTKVDRIEAQKTSDILKKLKHYNLVIIGYHKSNATPWKSYRLQNSEISKIQKIAKQNTTIFSVFTSPYALLDLLSPTDLESIVISYQNSKIAQHKTAQLLFGALGSKGKLPVSIGTAYPVGSGLRTKKKNLLSYGPPEAVDMSSNRLHQIDTLVNFAIREKMIPGAQLLVARKGKVVYQKNFGYHTYKKKLAVQSDDIYDLASLTKILATLPLVMELVDDGVLKLKTTIADLLPSFSDSNKKDITLKEMLSHYGRLRAWIPFFLKTLDPKKERPSDKYYRKKATTGFEIPVTEKLFFKSDMKDSLMLLIKESALREQLEYKYSDLPYYILKEFLETHFNNNLNAITRQHFYNPLGAHTMGYLPLHRFPKEKIMPTEDDQAFRKQIIHGYVHDQGAAMFGGIQGHAGLFGNANDVAKIMQMYLNRGKYGGRTFLRSKTISKFNRCYYCKKRVRRGIGFDKPQLKKSGPTCGCVSKESFGHSGFTGTFTWADPEKEIVYVFLSNRTFPDASNRKLISFNIRSEIQRIIQNAILD